jgi:pimeloyl-ACP methyl ester carboxylesterase
MTTGRVAANGITFGFIEEGSGPLVLLFHGFPDTAHTWDDVRPKIAAKGYRAVTPFMRGYHPTDIPERDADAETLGRDVLALIEALGEEQAIIIGHDWGASAVYGAAALDASRVSKLVAVGIPHPSTILPTPRKVWGVRHFFAFKLPGAATRFAANDFAALPAICQRWSPMWSPSVEELAPVRECFADRASLDAALGYYRALSFRPPAFLAPKIPTPTVVFSGKDDPNVDRADYERGKRKFTGEYTIEEMPGGHFMHREHPDIFAERLLAHLPHQPPITGALRR